VRRVLEEFPDAAAAMHQAMADELARLTDSLERVRQKLIAIDAIVVPAPKPTTDEV
jgi:hypothetical protein